MIFLLNIVVRFDATVDQTTRHDLLAKEHAIASAHLVAGRLRHIWRTPAQQGNWSIWEVNDPTELHDIVSSLPLYPWMTLSVHALADHPVSESRSSTHAVEPASQVIVQDRVPGANMDVAAEMRMLVSYAGKPGHRFDREYYMAQHIPMVERAWAPLGLKSADVLFSANNEQEVAVVCLCTFKTEGAMRAALSAPATAAIMADVERFTDIAPTQHLLASR